MKKLATLAIALWFATAGASEYPRVDADLKAYDEHVAALKAEFNKAPPAPRDKSWVQAKLQHMVDVDQYVRGMSELPAKRNYSDGERLEFNEQLHKRWAPVDATNTTELKELLKIYPWFTLSEFGEPADRNAWLLVQHADHDLPFQRQVLTILEPLAAKGESNPKMFAYLYDRIAVNLQNPAESKPQRYGTQGRCMGPGKWEPFPVEEPEKLDARRAQVGLDPEAEYRKLFVGVCHESTEETIRRAMEAAKKKYGNVTPAAPSPPAKP